MKHTDLLRRERELRRASKKEARLAREGGESRSIGDFINELSNLFFHDGKKIYNINNDNRILDLLQQLAEEHPEKQWDNVIRKAVKKSGVEEREQAVGELNQLMEMFD